MYLLDLLVDRYVEEIKFCDVTFIKFKLLILYLNQELNNSIFQAATKWLVPCDNANNVAIYLLVDSEQLIINNSVFLLCNKNGAVKNWRTVPSDECFNYFKIKVKKWINTKKPNHLQNRLPISIANFYQLHVDDHTLWQNSTEVQHWWLQLNFDKVHI